MIIFPIDLPSIYSGHVIGFLDPHKRFFEVSVFGQSQPERTSSYNWDFEVEEDAKDIERLSHQFQPFIQNMFGVTESSFKSGNFKGTMFRFPLRNKEMHSDLSSNCYDVEKVRQLLKSLEAEGDVVFLFLKNIKHIEFYEQMNETTTKLLEIKVPDKFVDPVVEGRQKLSNHIKANANEWYKKESLSVSYPLQTEVIDASGTNKSTTWIVTQHFGGRTSGPTTEQSIDGYLPLVGVASKHIKDTSSIDTGPNEPYGQIFCFMPLPLEQKSPTGFYFHVQGSFAVDQNRRHLKWISADQDPSTITDKDLIWNNFLLEKLLPVCLKEHYEHLMKEHKMLLNKQEGSDFDHKCAFNVYSVLPNETIVNHHWRNFITSFQSIMTESLELFSITTLTWQPSMPYILSSVNDELTDLFKRIMSEDRSALACLPEHLQQIVPRSSTPLSADHVWKSYKNVQKNISCSENEKIILLKYFLESLRNKLLSIKLLQGIQLLPLADDTWTTFEYQTPMNKIFVSNEEFNLKLFPMFENKFVCLSKLPNQSCTFFMGELINVYHSSCKMINIIYYVLLMIFFVPGHFNLQEVDRNIFADILKVMLSVFLNDKVELSSVNWFTYDWLRRIWNCLHRHFKDNLDCFTGLHLLLLSNNKVVKLTQKPTIIGTSVSEKNINKIFIKICNRLGIEFIETQGNDVYNHPCLWGKSILPPRLRSVLKFLILNPTNGFETFTDIENDYFISCLTSEIMLERLTTMEITVLRNCKIFKTVEGSAKQNAELVSLNEVNVAMAGNLNHVPPVPSFIKLVCLSNDSTKKLAESLSIKLLNHSCLLDEAFIPGIQHNFYNHEEVKLLMKYICRNFENISESTLKILSEIQFITKNDKKTLTKPRDLFDHEDDILINILEEDDFPGEEWRKPEFHHALIKLGLKSSNFITRDDCIKLINKLPNKCISSQRYNIFLKFLNTRVHMFDENFKNQIEHINWIRFTRSKPHGYPSGLNYYGEEVTQMLATVEDVVSSKFEKIVGSTCLLVNCKHLSVLEKFFGWNHCPNLDMIVDHLKNIVIKVEASDKISDILREIYSHLNQYSESELRMALKDDFPWVWNGEGFSLSNRMVKSHPSINTAPYIHELPVAFKHFDILWQSLNMPLRVDFIQTLALIKDHHEKTKNVEAGRVDHDLNVAIRILNHLAENCNSLELDQIIYVPIRTINSKLQMEALEDCVYCDKSWYQNGFDMEDIDDNIHLIHDKIPMKTAEKLNIASCLSKLLNVEEIQCWGQEEPITTRLRGLLKDYTDGLSVLKELIQNADDAGATEISFVFDERTNEGCQNILLSENMKDLQGPAIWCHNNAMFSDEDFRNITKLGGATKEHMSTKIGKFGLGFNSVYNLTEVPIFVSGDYVVFFDPHTKYLGKALVNKNSPGIKLKLTGNQKISRLRDQFAPFNGMFGCDCSPNVKIQKYQGTLFRFPLRTRSQALSSEICKKHYSKNEVIRLFECLIKAGADLFLFAQNLVTINIYHIDEGSFGSQMSGVYNVSREIKEVIQNVPRVIDFSYLNAVSKLKPLETNNDFMLQVETKETIKETEYFNIKSGDSKCNVWYVSWCSGIGQSYELYLENPTWLPIGAVAVKLELSDKDTWKLQEKTDGKMFCFMPLPCKSNLPFHVNGYFALNSSRTHMHMKVENDKTDRRWYWNEALLTDGVTTAYCNLLHHLAKQPNLNLYHIFPNISSWQDNCILVESIYNKLTNMNFSVFKSFVDDQMYSFNNCRILGTELQDKGFYQAIESALKSISTLNGIALLKLPQNIYSCLLEMDDAIKFQSKVIDLEEFYEEWFLPNLSIINIKVREEIIIETIIDTNLNGFIIEHEHACIPVTPNGESLKYIHELVDPASVIAKLFDEEDQMFPFVSNDMKERKSSYFRTLCGLGMRSDSLAEEEIIDRCYSVEICPDLMKERLSVLLDLIEKYLCKIDSGRTQMRLSFINTMKNIKMFPFKVKPNDYPLLWKEPNSCLISCKDGYLENKMLIAAPSNVVIDEAQSFKGGCPLIKSYFGLIDKLLSFESLQILIEELNKHFDESDNYSLRDRKVENDIKTIVDEVHKEIDSLIRRNQLDPGHILKLSELRFILSNGQPSRLLTLKQCRQAIFKSLLPYMCGVNETSLNKWDSICRTLEIKEKSTVIEFVDLLNTIEKKYRGIKLDDSTLNLVIDILECISNEIKGHNKVLVEFFLPNKEQILCPSSQSKYNDCNWSVLQSSEYCHDKISKSLAKELGIKTVRENSLSKSRLSYSFGQKEELVNRINRILSGYPMDESIFKEMIQNADDAMASEIHFINDTRKLPDEKVFCEEWKPLQGPALCIYNDKSFTLDDLDGIQKLGEGSKQSDITKTGQYGVGFNCVYHLTDAPSFMTTITTDDECRNNSEISGTVLAVFDPNCHFLPDSDSSNPGALYKSGIILKMFPDVHKGYLQNFEKYNVNKRGTMFRLPLRTFISRHKSGIKGSAVSTEKVEALLKEMINHESHLFLIFLKSLESIQVVKIAYDSSKNVVTETIQGLHLQFDVDSKARKTKFMQSTKELSKSLQSKDILLRGISSQEILHEVKVQDSNNKVSNWIIVHRFGLKDTSVISDKILEAYNEGIINLQPYGGIAFQIDSFYSNKMQNGKIFTFLPLARSSELPVHINGHFFLNHENRRDLWLDDKNTLRTEWNEALMSQIIVPAYCSLLIYLKEREMVLKKPKDFHKTLLCFYRLFPGELSEPLDIIRKEFYKYVFVNKLDLFLLFNPHHESVADWTNVGEEVYFDDLNVQLLPRISIYSTSETLKKAKILRETLYSCGLKIIVGPIELWNRFQKVEMEDIKKITPENVCIYLSSSSLLNDLPKKLEDTPFNSVKNVAAVLEYMSRDGADAPKLRNLPLLLSSSNILHKASDKFTLFESAHCNVAPHKLNCFIHPSVECFFSVESGVMTKLTIPNFADLMKDFSPLYSTNDKEKLLEFGEMCQHFNEFNGSSECCKWLKAVWNFISAVFKESNDLKPIQNMSIIPVKINKGDYLHPVHKMLLILKPFESSNLSSKALFESLEVVGVPILNMTLLNLCYIKKEVLNMFADIHDPVHVLTVLEDIYINFKSKKIPKKCQGLEILRYFERNITGMQKCSNACNILKALPFYIDINNQQIALSNTKTFIITQNIPQFDTQFLPRSHVFLKENFDFRNLFQFIKLSKLTDIEAYTKFLFDAFKHFNKESQMEHLSMIRDIANSNDNNFIQRLKDFSFIEYNGELRRASYFYDKNERLFELMKERFVPEPFDCDSWYEFLKKCGLIIKLSKEIFLGYAYKLPSLNVDTSKVQSLLIKCMINNYGHGGDWIDDNFLNQLKVIPFLYPSRIDKNLLDISSSYCKDNYISFKNSVLVKDVTLCWTVSNILPAMISYLILDTKLLKKLSVNTEIDSSLICRNLANISRGFEKLTLPCKQLNEASIKDLTDEHLSRLGSKHLDQQSMEILKSIKCLYVDEMLSLVQPNQISTDICSKDQIFPYIIQLPSFYGKHEKLLLQLGATKGITVGQCARALENIKSKIGGQKMDPNMEKICNGLFTKLLELAKQNISSFNDLKRLFLPCEGATLHDSAVIYCTNKHKMNAGVFHNLGHPVIITDDVELLLTLPESIRPKHLDNFLEEKLISLGEDANVPIVNNLQKNINHPNFLEGLIQIKNHYSNNSNQSEEQLESDFEYFSEKLKKIEFYGKEGITIQLALNGNIIENTRKQKPYFFEHDRNSDSLNIYISPGIIPFMYHDVSKQLANYFNIQSASFEIKEIICVDPTHIDGILERLELKTHSSSFKIPLGNEIPIEDHFTLVQDVHVYYPKQLVAYEVDDPFDRGEEGEPKYILVEIIQVQTNNNNVSRFALKYEVNFGSHQEVICSTRLYAFETKIGSSNVILLPNDDFGSENVVKTSTLSEIIDELKSVLKEIWELPEVERKKALKRLYLKYHPDKNTDNSHLFNEVFKHLKILIERLEKGLSIDDYNSKTSDKQDNQSTFYESHDWNKGYFAHMNRRARQHSYAKQKKGKNFQSAHSSSQRTYRNFFANFSEKRKNDPKKAELWMKQAQHDAEAALNDSNPEFKSAQWRCIKYYQVFVLLG